MSNRKRWLIVLSLTMAFSFFLAACGGGDELNEAMEEEANEAGEGTENEDTDANEGNAGEEAGDGGKVTIGLIGEPTMFHPLYTTDVPSADIEDTIFDGLVTIDEDLEIEGVLAEDWTISDDGLTYTFDLHEGVLFHDGEEMTADDVVFTYEIPMHEDYTGPRGHEFEDVEDIVAIDDYTVEFTLSEPNARFLSVLHYGVLPEHVLGDVPNADLEEHDFASEPIGTGPFQFVDWQDGEYVQVEAFDDYFRDGPYLDGLVFSIIPDQNAAMAQMEAGELDFLEIPANLVQTAEEWEEDGLIDFHTTEGYSYNYMGYNLQLDMFADKETRQALTHALDRETIIDAVVEGEGEVAHAPMSPLSWAYPDDVPKFEYDPEKAQELFAEAGWEEGDDGILERDGERFSFTLSTNQGNEVRENLTVVIQDQLAEVGVEVQPETQEWASFIDRINPPNYDFEAIILGWALAPDPDPSRYWHSSEIEAGNNNISYSREDLDEMMDESIRLVDQEERAELLQDIFAEIAEDQPYTFLYFDNDLHATNPALEDFIQHPRYIMYNVHEWKLAE